MKHNIKLWEHLLHIMYISSIQVQLQTSLSPKKFTPIFSTDFVLPQVGAKTLFERERNLILFYTQQVLNSETI